MKKLFFFILFILSMVPVFSQEDDWCFQLRENEQWIEISWNSGIPGIEPFYNFETFWPLMSLYAENREEIAGNMIIDSFTVYEERGMFFARRMKLGHADNDLNIIFSGRVPEILIEKITGFLREKYGLDRDIRGELRLFKLKISDHNPQVRIDFLNAVTEGWCSITPLPLTRERLLESVNRNIVFLDIDQAVDFLKRYIWSDFSFNSQIVFPDTIHEFIASE